MKNIFQKMDDKHGSALIGALLILLTIGFFGANLASMGSSDDQVATNDLNSLQAFYATGAGLEYAKMKIDAGQTPDVAGQPFDPGTFTIVSNAQSGLVSVTGKVGGATKSASITSTFAKDCMQFDTASVNTSGKNLNNVKLVKSCLQSAVMTKMNITWNWGVNVHVTGIGFENAVIYDSQSNIGTPLGLGASSGVDIDVTDAVLTANASHQFTSSSFPIRFDTNHPGQGTYTIAITFSDGSQITKTFQDPTLPAVPPPPPPPPGFATATVGDGSVEVQPSKLVKVQVLGSAITNGPGGAEIDVRVELGTKVGNHSPTYTKLFGDHDVDGGEVYTTTAGPTGTTYLIRGRTPSTTYASSNTAQVKTLINGNTAPPLAGFGGQKPITEFLAPYLNAQGKVVLAPNQVIMLFELGVNVASNPNSPAADFQDLVVLLTMN